MIRLTIARYYTPSGRCIQKPYDSTANLDGRLTGENSQDKYNQELIDRFNHGEMIHADSIHFADSLKAQTKRMGRTVYGGGGIMPDFFVPIDTTQYTDYHRNLVAKGCGYQSHYRLHREAPEGVAEQIQEIRSLQREVRDRR